MKVQVGTKLRPIASFEKLLRLKRFEASHKSRRVTEVEQIICELKSKAADLDLQVRVEEERTKISDPANCAYSTFAQNAMRRRDNLRDSVAALSLQLEAARCERDKALEQLEQLVPPDAAETLEKKSGWDGTNKPSQASRGGETSCPSTRRTSTTIRLRPMMRIVRSSMRRGRMAKIRL